MDAFCHGHDPAGNRKNKVDVELQFHIDLGFQFAPHGYLKLIESYSITPSASRKGNLYGNAMAENFFPFLKTECIYTQQKTFEEANNLIGRRIHYYNHESTQYKTGVAPLTLRHSAWNLLFST